MCEIANNLLMCYKMEVLGSYLDFVPPAYHTEKWADLSLFQLIILNNILIYFILI